jgi:hypothetical protein
MEDIDKSFFDLIEVLKKQDLNDKRFIKQMLDDDLKEFDELYDTLDNINWDSEKSIDNGYQAAAFSIYSINYVYLLQMVMCEEVENYEAAKHFYEIAYHTYYAINQYTNPNFDASLIKDEIKELIKVGAEHIKEVLKEIEQNDYRTI